MFLTVEVKDQTVEMYFDDNGLDFLMERLNVLKTHGGHEHFMTKSWGSGELSEVLQGDGNELAHHLVLVKRKNAPGPAAG